MSNTCVLLVLFLAFVSCTFSSYLDIPPPPERPTRFKTKEQIETYLKAVKDYYDAFKIKLVRRENSLVDLYSNLNNNKNDDNDEDDIDDANEDDNHITERLHLLGVLAKNHNQAPQRIPYIRQRYRAQQPSSTF